MRYNKKLKLVVIKKRSILVLFLCAIFIICVCFAPQIIEKVCGNVSVYTIVIDAGHGGIDGGSVGASGTVEREINLEYAKCLSKLCSQFGMKVIMTRTNQNGLYSAFAKNKKKDDMQKRKQIIEKTRPDIVISIHMNSFSLSSARGAQVCYDDKNDNSKLLADSIQQMFVKNIDYAKSQSQKGDYYIVNCTTYASVIVECGYISNREEEQLLCQNDYKEKICYNILCGALSFLSK